MVRTKKINGKKKAVSNEQILRVMNKGFANVRKEMKELHTKAMDEIVIVRKELKEDIVFSEHALSHKIDAVAKDLKNLHFEVHQNQTALIVNNVDLEKRVTALEARAA